MDWTKLTSAPWVYGPAQDDEKPKRWVVGADALLWASVIESPGRSAQTDSTFIALARNFADVCERRGWGVRRSNGFSMRTTGWVVISDMDNTLTGIFDNLFDAWQAAVDYDAKLTQEGQLWLRFSSAVGKTTG